MEHFCIENQHAKLEFIESVDLNYVNLDQVVQLEDKSVEVYPDEYFENTRPMKGSELNTVCLITYKNYAKKPVSNQEKFLK